MLRSPEQIHDYLSDYLSQPGVTLPPGLDLGMKAGRLAKGLVAKTITDRIEAMAGNFIAGADAAAALPVLRNLWKQGVAFSVDLLGEACVSDAEAEVYQRRYLDLLEVLPAEVGRWPAEPRLENDHLGPVPRTSISIKVSALSPRTDPIDFEGSLRTLAAALEPILRKAAEQRGDGLLRHGAGGRQGPDDRPFPTLLRERSIFPPVWPCRPTCGAGRKTPPADRLGPPQRPAGERAADQGRLLGLRADPCRADGLARAGLDRQTGHRRLLRAHGGDVRRGDAAARGQGGVKLALGSHNVRSIAHTLALLEKKGLPPSAVEFQKLYGMADPLREALVEQGLRVREYVPVGEMIPGMAYLVRRLLENTSNQSWLRTGFSAEVPDDVLLAAPDPKREPASRSGSRDQRNQAERTTSVAGIGIRLTRCGDPASAFAGRCRAGRRSADVQRALARFFPGRSAAAFCQRGGRGRRAQGRGRRRRRLPEGHCHGRRGLCRMARSPALGPLADPRAGRRRDARRPRSAGRRDDSRGGQDLARGRCRRLRGHRLLRVLRPRGRRAVPAATAWADSWAN